MEFVGILFQIGEIESIEGPVSFTKRPFFLKYFDSKNKEQIVKFVLYDPNLNIVNNFEIDQKIKVNYDFKGLISAKTGKFFEEKIANNISLIKEINSSNNKFKGIPNTNKLKPDFTKNYDSFPEELVY